MKFLPLIWSGIWRKPGRTILTLMQVIVAFALFGVLQGMKTGVEEAIEGARADVLFVAPAAFGGAPLRRADIERLKAVRGVKTVAFADGFLGTYQKPTQHVYVLAIDSSDDVWLSLIPEVFQVSPKDLQALRRTRTGVLINADIAKKYGWRLGDRIPLTSATLQTDGSGAWVFDIVGTFSAREMSQGSYIVANYAYLDEARALNKGTVRNYYAVAADPKQAAPLADAIDSAFANSPNETRTASFKELAQQEMQSIGDLDFAIRSIVSAVLVALLFSLATMMMQTTRERTAELAVLKALGFSNGTVFLLLVGEAITACIAGAIMGLALATVVFPYAAKFVPGLSMPTIVIVVGVIGAVLVALISASVPAFRASKLAVVDALAGR
ncbi:FtsX-like permease family protein [Steroidobacter sp. S1-65]|uniref:FtsX-like permease family protein n=1 Tax=Steroidobacter gossypii TaxID=2805490 RepID=A0ABS1WXT7_9GAMM|nr:FtsX-like permease family protein [Steroidobacter gossypii]MBM0105752.1 FtsX-like permease family protein [Steroidobacter gossypii]